MATNRGVFLEEMLKSEEYSDLRFTCNEHIFRVHKAVVCAQSPVVRAALSGHFKESEANAINMDSFHPMSVRNFVRFLYTGDYDATATLENPDGESSRSRKQEADTISKQLIDLSIVEGGADSSSCKLAAAPPVPPPTTSVTELICEHIRVNSIGHYYGVEALVSLANGKISALVHKDGKDQSWIADLPKLTAEALESTGDSAMLEILASATARNMSALTKPDWLRDLGAAWACDVAILQACAQHMDAQRAKITRRSRTISELESRISQLEGKIEALSSKNDRFAAVLRQMNDTAECRNLSCQAPDFSTHIDPDELILRCRHCKCKH
ncbi:hypothetical protein CDD83_1861 [Cordyceps sp. RAO-2017]|nr:hypothetical protein CDD83_1861 [Cordyceps sp. RAO-2017]